MEEKCIELDYQLREFWLLREESGVNHKQFALESGIPFRAVEDWEDRK